MDAITFNTLNQRLSESCGDWIQVNTTANIGANTNVVSTSLNEYDQGRDDYFNNWHVFFSGTTNNADTERKVEDYDATTTKLDVFGGVLTANAGAETFELTRYKRTDKENAINETFREIYPALHKRLDNQILIVGNWLPNAHFEDQATAGTPDKYTLTNVTGAAETTTIRGGAKAVKLTDSGSGLGYMYVGVTDWPRLLDLSGQTVSLYCWVYATTANDAWVQIETTDKANATQALKSTTTCVASKWTLIELKDQALNDDLTDIKIEFGITSLSGVVIFDDARLMLSGVQEYLLPEECQDGNISRVEFQTSGTYLGALESIAMCDSLQGRTWQKIYDWDIISDGGEKFLRLNSYYPPSRRLRLIGTAPFSALSTQLGTITIDQQRVPLLVAYAKYKLFSILQDIPASTDIERYERASAKAYGEYMILLPNLGMPQPSGTMRLPIY